MDLASPAVSGTSVYANGLIQRLSTVETKTDFCPEQRSSFLHQTCIHFAAFPLSSIRQGLFLGGKTWPWYEPNNFPSTNAQVQFIHAFMICCLVSGPIFLVLNLYIVLCCHMIKVELFLHMP